MKDWLTAAMERGEAQTAPPTAFEAEGRRTPVLRGVREIHPDKLREARRLVAVRVDEGKYLVASEAVLIEAAKYEDLGEFMAFVNRPYYARRRTLDTRTGATISVEDLDGWNSYYVSLNDKHIDPCHCRYMYIDAVQDQTVCKHILAALIAEGNPKIAEMVNEQEREERIVAALKRGSEDV
jgi:hypothetical protein